MAQRIGRDLQWKAVDILCRQTEKYCSSVGCRYSRSVVLSWCMKSPRILSIESSRGREE